MSSGPVKNLPSASVAALKKLGSDLQTARKRRRESLAGWAARLNVSAPTVMRMEEGDPAVSAGTYATALWLLRRENVLAQAADPKEDAAALEAEIREAQSRHRPRGARG